MAEIQSQQLNQKHAGVKRGKKLSTRVDLTPMVDLGFLLITFFIFTTSLTQPMAFKLALPDESHPPIVDNDVNEHKVISLVLKDNQTVGYYFGTDLQHMQFTDYATGVRKVILQKKADMLRRYGRSDDLMVLIKPTDNAAYGNVVNALDEMLITNVKIYMLLDARPEEALVAVR